MVEIKAKNGLMGFIGSSEVGFLGLRLRLVFG